MEENENENTTPAEDGESRPKTEEELAESTVAPKHGVSDDDIEGPGVDPGNSPPDAWTEDMTADEIDAVAKQLEDHAAVEKIWDESTPKGDEA
jgi:hypothetical protein